MINPRIMIIRNNNIGDMVMASCVFREIKRYMPNSNITLITSKISKPLIEKNKNIDRIIDFEIPKNSVKSIYQFWKLSRILKKDKYDIGIDLRGSNLNSLFLLLFSGIKNRISRVDIHNTVKLFVNKPIYPKIEQHIIYDNLQIIKEGLEIPAKNAWPEISTNKKDEKEVKDYLIKRGIKKFICICPVASLDFKQWPLEYFKLLIEQIAQNNPQHRILLMGTHQDKDKIVGLISKNCIPLFDFNLRLLSLLFKKADAVLAQDGGPMHIAWASKAKLIALMPKTPIDAEAAINLNKVLPIKSKVIFSKKDYSMEGIEVKDVVKEITSLLE